MTMLWAAVATLVFSVTAVCEDASSHPKLMGTWEGDNSKTDQDAWLFEAKGEGLHVTHSQKGERLADFVCNTMGTECKAGRQTKVSMWFNGPKLVLLETHGSEVVRRRFVADEAGDTLAIEVTQVVPAGKPEVVRFHRRPPPPAK
jgi:hypothetical protein